MTTPAPRSFKVGCKTTPDETWAYNAMRFPTLESANEYGEDLYNRWLALREWEVHESEDPVHYYDGQHQLVSE